MTLTSEHAVVSWLRTSRTNTGLTARAGRFQLPAVTMPDEDRWRGVGRLLNDASLRRYTRIGGLFTLLFAQPLSRIVSMRTSQVAVTADRVEVTFSSVATQMPAILDDLVRDHLNERGLSQYGRQTPTGSSPAASPDTTCRRRTSAASSLRSVSSPWRRARRHCSSWPPT